MNLVAPHLLVEALGQLGYDAMCLGTSLGHPRIYGLQSKLLPGGLYTPYNIGSIAGFLRWILGVKIMAHVFRDFTGASLRVSTVYYVFHSVSWHWTPNSPPNHLVSSRDIPSGVCD